MSYRETQTPEARTGTWVESLYGDADHGPYADVLDASEAMNEMGLDDGGYKIVIYGEDGYDGPEGFEGSNPNA